MCFSWRKNIKQTNEETKIYKGVRKTKHSNSKPTKHKQKDVIVHFCAEGNWKQIPHFKPNQQTP